MVSPDVLNAENELVTRVFREITERARRTIDAKTTESHLRRPVPDFLRRGKMAGTLHYVSDIVVSLLEVIQEALILIHLRPDKNFTPCDVEQKEQCQQPQKNGGHHSQKSGD